MTARARRLFQTFTRASVTSTGCAIASAAAAMIAMRTSSSGRSDGGRNLTADDRGRRDEPQRWKGNPLRPVRAQQMDDDRQRDQAEGAERRRDVPADHR